MQRRKTIEVRVGGIGIGGENPVRVQTMTNTDTNDISGSVEQIKRCVEAGAEIIRLTTQGVREVDSLKKIKYQLREEGYNIPIVADVHFSAEVAIRAAEVADKVRMNPGNFIKPLKRTDFDYTLEEFEQEKEILRQRFLEFVDVCKIHNTAIRIGVNHGSLGERMMNKYGDTPTGMVESCLEVLRFCREASFDQIVISLKASNTVLMTEAVKLLVEKMDEDGFHFPLHLGVTEAGEGEDGRIKSAIGIGSLLAVGIGDTIRVSLSEDPEEEIPVAFAILQATRSRITKTEYISCPSCGRTMFDIKKVIKDVKEKTSHLVGLKIAVMGCIVNGPGEMADADYGYVGAGRGKISLYRGAECIEKNIPQEQAIDKLLEIIENDKANL